MQSNRQRFFNVLEGRPVDRLPFFPDISSWYVAMRRLPGERERYGPGCLIPDDDVEFHRRPGAMPAVYRDWTCLDFYRRLDWGLPVHVYDWYEPEYDGVDDTTVREGDRLIRTWRCAAGELRAVRRQAADGSLCPVEFPIKTPGDLAIHREISRRSRYRARPDRVAAVLDTIGQQGVCDLVIPRSPFGKLVHELMGFEAVVYALADEPARLLEWMADREPRDLELIDLAADMPARIVILSDHADENLISPLQFREYLLPYYRCVTDRLHRAGKLVSTHLDGNFKGYMPSLPETGFDLLDGCTPYPMTNWRPAELAGVGLPCYCGVPSALVCRGGTDAAVREAAEEILRAFAPTGRMIPNIGDIVTGEGDIRRVILAGDVFAGREGVER